MQKHCTLVLMDNDERLTQVEMKLAYLEDFMNQIQEVAVNQAKEIEMLHKENKIMADKIRDLVELTEGDIPNRKPPHY